MDHEGFSTFLRNSDLTPEQTKLMMTLGRDKLGIHNDGYFTFDECKQKLNISEEDYNRFTTTEGGVFEYISAKHLICIENSREIGMSKKAQRIIFPHISLYGLSLCGNFYNQLQTLKKEGLVPRSWLYDEKDVILPKGSVSFARIIQTVFERFEVETQNLDILLAFILRFLYATDFGPAITEKNLQLCFELSLTLNFDESYILGTLDTELCMSAFFGDQMCELAKERLRELDGKDIKDKLIELANQSSVPELINQAISQCDN